MSKQQLDTPASGYDCQWVMKELEKLGKEQYKKIYLTHGIREPLFGVTTGSMKPLKKLVKKNYPLAMELYATGNYDAMYFAGMITDPAKMTEADFEAWMKQAYCAAIGDSIVSVTLAETEIAEKLADRWIASGNDLYMSAGWSCYSWLLGTRKDDYFEQDKLAAMLDQVKNTIHSQPNRTQYAMNGFMISVGTHYLPLHEEAVRAADQVGRVDVQHGGTNCKTPLASDYIQRAVDRGRIGFKRRNVRC